MKSTGELTASLDTARRHYQTIIDVHDMLKEVGGMERLYNETQQRLKTAKDIEDKHLATLSGIQKQIDTASARHLDITSVTKAKVDEADAEAARVVAEAHKQALAITTKANEDSLREAGERAKAKKSHEEVIAGLKATLAGLNTDIESAKAEHAQWKGKVEETKAAVAKVLAPLGNV